MRPSISVARMIPTELAFELSSSPGRFGLIAQGLSANAVVDQCEDALGAKRCSVGTTLAELTEFPSSGQIEEALGVEPLLVDIEVLFAPQLAVDPLALLRQLARSSSPRVALWPGTLKNGRGYFSEPQRYDRYDQAADDVLVLRPVLSNFPDEPCCEIERWHR